MEAQYERLKLSTLKDLLENRGRPANNRKKRDIIRELVEMDGTERPSVTDRTPEEASFDRAVKLRLAQYGPNPPAEIIDLVIAAVDANWLHQKGAAAAEVTAAPTARRGEVQIPAAMEEEVRRRLQEMQIQHRGPVSEEVLLGWSDSIRCELWKKALALEQQHQGKVLPSIYVRYWSQYDVRMPLLGEQPKQEWTTELSRLIRAEMRLDESYRALRWYVAQECPWSADDSPTEGFDYNGLGLLYWRLSEDPDFGSDQEWRLEEIMEHREQRLNVSEGHWAQEDLEFLAVQEWELEIAYKQLLDSTQQQGGAPFAWDYQELPVDNYEILAEESAVENLKIATLKAEVDDMEFQGARAVGSSPQPQITEGMDLMDCAEDVMNYASPAQVLAAGQSTADPCSTPVAVLEARVEKVMVPLSEWISEMQGGEAAIFPPQQVARADGVESPAGVLATGQSDSNLCCPAPETTVEFQGAGAVGPSLQQQAGVVKLLPPAESLAAGQNATGRCTQLPLERISVDGTAVSTHSNPAEELATEPSATGLGSQLTEEGVPVVLDGTSVLTDTTPENGVTLRQEDVSLALQALGDFHLPQVDGTSVSTCIPQGCRAVDPDPQQHDGLSPVTLSSLQRQKGLQGEGPVQASPQRRVCSLREAEVGWVSDSLFGEIYLGYCVDTGIRRRDLWTNFGVNPSGVPPSVSLLPKGERCNGKARGTQNRLGSMKYPCASFPNGSYVSITLCLY